MADNFIQFIRQKDYKEVRILGQGGTGQTRLIEDDIINAYFVCKKYSPYYPELKEKYFKNFVDEIKLLHTVYHKNIVRVFNYFLYPEHLTGYILMEYIDGCTITEYCKKYPQEINNIFEQTIEAFRHLEELQILHRDIRPANIMVSTDSVVKIIDFGFGKKIDFTSGDFNNSVKSINWYYETPDEFEDEIYDFSTDVYFIGKLFKDILQENKITTFKYSSLLQNMTDQYIIRLGRFSEISRLILNNSFEEFEFTETEKSNYLNFVDLLSKSIASIGKNADFIKDTDQVLIKLEQVYRNSMLEINIQYIPAIIYCFIKGTYRYFKNTIIPVTVLKEFINFYRNLGDEKKTIVLNNIWTRMEAIEKIEDDVPDDLPF